VRSRAATVAADPGGAERIAAALTEARGAIDEVVSSSADGRTAAERLQERSETLERVTSRLEGVGADAAEAAPADGALAYS
jgi:hypothetical protein